MMRLSGDFLTRITKRTVVTTTIPNHSSIDQCSRIPFRRNLRDPAGVLTHRAAARFAVRPAPPSRKWVTIPELESNQSVGGNSRTRLRFKVAAYLPTVFLYMSQRRMRIRHGPRV